MIKHIELYGYSDCEKYDCPVRFTKNLRCPLLGRKTLVSVPVPVDVHPFVEETIGNFLLIIYKVRFSSKNILCQQSGRPEKLDPIPVRFQDAEPGNSSLKFPRIYFDAV